MQQISLALFFILIAGIINGSFALPTKYITHWKFENIWLQFAIWAFILLPCGVIYYLVPELFKVYEASPANLLWIIFAGGVLFGIGQLCFAFALNIIGLGLGFVINLGVGISLGLLLPLLIQHSDHISTPFGYVTLIGTACAVIGLIISNHAGILRDRDRRTLNSVGGVAIEADALAETAAGAHGKHALGVILAIIAGIFSAGQNFTFSFTYQLQDIARQLNPASGEGIGAASVIWPLFLICAFIPYALYMLFLLKKNKSFVNYSARGTGKYYLFAIIMGLFWFGSLMFYSKASQLIGSLGPIVGWPLFMVLIILVSSFWGWKHKEWVGCGNKAKNIMKLGIAFLMLAIIVLALGAGLSK